MNSSLTCTYVEQLIGAVTTTFDHYKVLYNYKWLDAVKAGEAPRSGALTPEYLRQGARFAALNLILYVVQLGYVISRASAK